MKEEATNMTLANEVVAALVADGCRGDGRMAERLRSDCGKALGDLGARMPDGMSIRVAENTPDMVHVPLPHYKFCDEGAAATMSEDELKQISAGEVIIAVLIGVVGFVGFGTVIGGAVALGVLCEQGRFDTPSQTGRRVGTNAAAVNTVGGNPE